MSVRSCALMVSDATLKIDNKFNHTYVHKFLVEMTSGSDLQPDVEFGMYSASPDPIPAIWSSYSMASGTTLDDAGSFLQDIDIKRQTNSEDNNRFWVVTCTWKPAEAGHRPGSPPTLNPLDEPVRYSMEWANYTRLCEKDHNGDPILNGAGDGFDPPIEIDDARPVLVAVKNMDGSLTGLAAIVALAIEYKNAVNTDTFHGATARQAKVESIISGQTLNRNGIDYYAVTFRIQFNEETWDYRIIDRGNHSWTLPKDLPGTSDPAPVKIRTRVYSSDVHNGELLDFANLNPDGTQRGIIDPDEPALFVDPPFRIYPEKAFSGLGV